jgi:hypothetical protein
MKIKFKSCQHLGTILLLTTALLLSLAALSAMPSAVSASDPANNILNVANWSEPTELENVSGRPEVRKAGNTYHMWYGLDDDNLYHAASTDPGDFPEGSKTNYDIAPAECGSVTVYYEGESFYMIAYGDNDDYFAIYNSTDGDSWEKQGIVFDGTGLPGYSKLDAPYLFEDNGTFRLYFQVKAEDGSIYSIYTAETDDTLAEIADGNDDSDFALANSGKPVLEPSGTVEDWDGKYVMHPMVIKEDNVYYMWYSAHNSNQPQQIGFASSEDGYTWVKSTGNPIISRDNYLAVGEPSVIYDEDDGVWRMWYLATENQIKYLSADGPFEFSSIQSAIDAADDGDTINAAEGTYTENIVINKSITLYGANAGTNAMDEQGDESIIDAGLDDFGVLIIGEETVATLDGFTIDNYETCGILAGALSTALGEPPERVFIKNNIVNAPSPKIDAHNICIQVGNGTTGEITGNKVTGARLESEDWSGSGILIAGSSNVNVSENYVDDCETGICIAGYEQSRDAPSNNNIIEYNIVENNETGISIQMKSLNTIIRYNHVLNSTANGISSIGNISWEQNVPSGTQVHHNIISENTNFGVKSSVWEEGINPESVNATLNYWGDAAGPYNETTNPESSGNAVSDNVAYSPWYTSDDMNETASNTPIYNEDKGIGYYTIQAAIDAADDGDIISVAEGTYVEDILLNIPLNLVGDDQSEKLPVIEGTLTVDYSGENPSAVIQNIAFSASDNHSLILENALNTDIINCLFDADGRFMTDQHINAVQLGNRSNVSGVTIEDCIIQNGYYVAINGYADNLTVKNSLINDVKSGINIQAGNNLVVENTNISAIAQGTENDTYCLRFANDSNTSTDMAASGGEFSVDKNGMTASEGIYHSAIVIRSGAAGELKANGLSIDGEVVNLSTTELDATGNYWGATDSVSIEALISGTGNVNYDPWQLKAPTGVEASNITASSLILEWDISVTWRGDYYDFRYSTTELNDETWDEAVRIASEPVPEDGNQQMIIRELDAGQTYYFGMLITDGVNRSDIATFTVTTESEEIADTAPPAAITDLSASEGTPSTTRIDLTWTAPEDEHGYVGRYIIKRHSETITGANWDDAVTVYNNLEPKAPGQTETFTVRNLTPDTLYHFALESVDGSGNISDISDSADYTTGSNLPSITGISPSNSNNGETVTLTIEGNNLNAGNPSVRLVSSPDIINLTDVTVNSDTEIEASVPKGTPSGTYKTRVINDNGTSELSAATYEITETPIPLPAVTNIRPNMAVSGETLDNVVITGRNFGDGAAVTINGQNASNIVVNSSTRITITAPALDAGEYDVVVLVDGLSNEISAVKYIVDDPVIINEDSTADTSTSSSIKTTGTIPVEVTLTTNNEEEAAQNTDIKGEISVVIPPQTEVTDKNGNSYDGVINPPRVVKPDENSQLPETAVVIEMGNPEETISFNQDFTATVRVESDEEPEIYYYNKDTGEYELAGKIGTVDGIDYVPGGTLLTVEEGIYTIGLLLDHMSTYVASSDNLLPEEDTEPSSSDGGGVPAPEPETINVSISGFTSSGELTVNELGIVNADVRLDAGFGDIIIAIPEGTKLLDSENNPLRSITASEAASAPAAPSGSRIILAYDLDPAGAKFSPALTLTMQYDPDDLPGGTSPEDLFIAYYDEELETWVEMQTDIDESAGTLSAEISNFTIYSIIVRVPAAEAAEPPEGEIAEIESTPSEPEETRPEDTEPEPTGAAPDDDTNQGFPWYWIIVGVAAVIVIVLVVMFVRRRS